MALVATAIVAAQLKRKPVMRTFPGPPMKLSAERTAEIVAGTALLGMAGFTAWMVIVGVRQEALTVGELLDLWGLCLFLILLVGGATAFGIRLVMPKPRGKPALNRAAYVLLAYAWVLLAVFGIISGAASVGSVGLMLGAIAVGGLLGYVWIARKRPDA